MAFFNLAGLLIAVGCGVCVVFGIEALPRVGVILSRGEDAAYTIVLWGWITSLLALTWDRCDLQGLWRSYQVNTSQFFMHALGQPLPPGVQWNPHRRLAVFMWPLALSPIIVLAVAVVTWAVDTFRGLGFAAPHTHAVFCAGSAAAFLAAWLYAHLTRSLRICAPIDGLAEHGMQQPPPTTAVGQIAQAVRGDDSPAAPTRRTPTILFLGGLFALTFSHYLIVSGEKGYLLLTLLAPSMVFMGLGGLVDPRIIWSCRAEGRMYPWWVRGFGAMLTAAGIGVGAYLVFYVYSL